MRTTPHELYEYARLRIKQKKKLYFHFVLFLISSLFMLVANKIFKVGLIGCGHISETYFRAEKYFNNINNFDINIFLEYDLFSRFQ